MRLPDLDDRSRRDFLHKTVTATGSDVNPRLTRKLVALLLLAVVACGGSVQDEPKAGTTGSSVPPTEAATTLAVDESPEISEPVEFPTLEELEVLLSPLVDLSQVAGITSYRFRSVIRGEAETGWWVVEGAVDEALPATLLRIEDPVQGIFHMLSSGDRFWQAGADQVFRQTEPPMEWPLFWPIPSYESATGYAADVLEAGPEVVGIEEIGEVSVLHLRASVEGTEGNLWFELHDINGDIQINLPG